MTSTADFLLGLQKSATTCDALADDLIPADHDAAYAAQDALVDMLGSDRVGYKVAATGPVPQKMLGVDSPLWGQIVASMLNDSPCKISMAVFASSPIVEAEIGLVIPEDGGTPTHARPVIELAASRFNNMAKAGSASGIADNIAATAFAVGSPVALADLGDLAAIEAVLTIDGEEKARGLGEAVLGNPLNSLQWLRDDLAACGRELPGGSIVSTGAIAIARGMAAGQHIVADFGPLGRVEVNVQS